MKTTDSTGSANPAHVLMACEHYQQVRDELIFQKQEALIADVWKTWKPAFRWCWWHNPPAPPSREEAIAMLKVSDGWWESPWFYASNPRPDDAKRVRSLEALARFANRSTPCVVTLTAADADLLRKYMP